MKMIIESFLMYKLPLSIIIGLIATYFVIKTLHNNRTKNVKKSDAESIFEELNNLSASKNKTKYNSEIIYKILEKDYKSILTCLKSESLCFYKLFAIKANIENEINSYKILEKTIGKIFGVLIAFMIGVITTVFLGSYSGTIGTLASEIVKNEKKDNLNNDSINELTQSVENVFTKINFDERINFWLFIASFISLLVVVAIAISNNQYKFDNRVNVLLDLVNYAIEYRKEEEILKSKDTANIAPKEPSKNEPIEEKKTPSERLGSKLLHAKSTNKLLKELDNKLEYNTIKKEISNCKSPQLHNIKANLKNALDAGSYFYIIILQVPTTLLAVLLAIQEKEWRFKGVVVSFIIVLVFLLWVGYVKVYTKDNTNKILFLEIVKEEIESKKKASVKNSARKTRRPK